VADERELGVDGVGVASPIMLSRSTYQEKEAHRTLCPCRRLWRCPLRRATIHLHRIEPGLAELVLLDPDLTLPGKLALLYVLSHPHDHVHARQELADVDQQVADHLDEVVHELVGRRWLATVPPDAPPCLAARFQLREDHDPELEVDGALGLAHLGAGVTWVAGGGGNGGNGRG
jgi:hypothetical protein